jgi:endonuclease-3
VKSHICTFGRKQSPSHIRSRLEEIAKRLRSYFGVPRRKTKLPEPLDLLVATVLSQNTNDLNSHKAFLNLKKAYPNLSDIKKTHPRKVETLIKVGGIARRKSRVIIQIVREVEMKIGKFNRRALNKINRDELIDKLCSMKGVGYKTASCVLLFSLGDNDAFPVDTHVHRILNRIGVVSEKAPDKTFLTVRTHIPPGSGYELHINLIKFGREICTARNPRCYGCRLFDICEWKGKGAQLSVAQKVKNRKKVDFVLLEKV